MSEANAPVLISVIVPVYGNGEALDSLTERTASVLRALAGEQWEVILVNDGSPRECWKKIQQLAMRFSNVRGINLRRNFGQHNALLAGINASRGDTIITMDDDLQHPPEEIPSLLSSLTGDFDVMYGTPMHQSHSWWRNLGATIAKATLATVLGVQISKKICAFRVFRGQLRKSFFDYRSPYVSIDVLLSWMTTRIGSVAVRHEPRHFGDSTYTLWRLLRHLVNMVTGFSVWPLRLASLLGLAFFVFGMIILAYVLGRFL